MNKIKENSHYCGDGMINFDQSCSMKYHKSYLSRLAMENPIAYVAETKSDLNHVLSILFGCPQKDSLVHMKEFLLEKTIKTEGSKRELLEIPLHYRRCRRPC